MNEDLTIFLSCLDNEQVLAFRRFALTMPRMTSETIKIIESTMENRESLERKMLLIAGKGY